MSRLLAVDEVDQIHGAIATAERKKTMSGPMEIATLKDVMTLGDVLAKSGFFADARGAAQAVVKVLAGRELGFGPIASMTGVHIVKGKPVMASNLQAAAVKRSGKYDYKVREHTTKVCKLEFFEKSDGKWLSAGESSFDENDAKTAGLLGGDNWRHYPKNMLFARAMSNGIKFYCPDVTNGPVYTPDELGIDVDGETGEVKNLSSVTVAEIPDAVGGAGVSPASQRVAPSAPADSGQPSSNPEDHRAESESPFPKPDEDRVMLIAEITKLAPGIPEKDRADAKRTYGMGKTLESTDTSALSDYLKWMRARVK